MREPLLRKLDLGSSEILRLDLLLAVAGGLGSAWVQATYPPVITGAVSTAAGAVGVIIGAVLASVAVISAFMDKAFLERIRAIGRSPIRYVAPFVFTTMLGIVALVLLLVRMSLPPTLSRHLYEVVTGCAALFAVWTLTSMFPLLAMLIDFVDLKAAAAEVTDEAVAQALESKKRGRRRKLVDPPTDDGS